MNDINEIIKTVRKKKDPESNILADEVERLQKMRSYPDESTAKEILDMKERIKDLNINLSFETKLKLGSFKQCNDFAKALDKIVDMSQENLDADIRLGGIKRTAEDVLKKYK